MTKLKKFTDFLNSLRFRLILLLILIGVIPCVLLRIGMLNSYENRAVSLRTSEILSQAKILANQIVSNDYLENSGSPTINAQLELCSSNRPSLMRVVNRRSHAVVISSSVIRPSCRAVSICR